MSLLLGDRRRFGVSADAFRLASMEKEHRDRQMASVTYQRTGQGHRQTADEILFDAWCECAKEGWDGEGGKAVSRERLLTAVRLVQGLPADIPPPDPCGEPDGDFCLEWYRGPRRLLAVSVGENGILFWSALHGDEDARGKWRYAPQSGDNVPDELIHQLVKLYRNARSR
jgi:hypothetical protein